MTLTADDGMLMIRVEDDGPGLSPQALDLLSGRSTRPISTGEGAGLGLWVSRRLALEFDGTVEAGRSDLGGAAITVRFPIQPERTLNHAA